MASEIFEGMTLNDYQEKAMTTRTEETYGDAAIIYPTLGLTGEAGEVADKVKKVLRGDYSNREFSPERKHDIALELGDVMWYVAALSHDLGYTLDEIAQMNIQKLHLRQIHGKIHGNGDER